MKIIRTFLGKVLLCTAALHLALAAGGTVLLAGCAKGNDDPGMTKPTDRPSVEDRQGGYLFAHMTNADYGSLFYSISRDGLSWETLNGGKVILESYFGHPDICEGPDVFGKAGRRWYMIGVVRGSSKESLVLWHTTDLVVWKNRVLDGDKFVVDHLGSSSSPGTPGNTTAKDRRQRLPRNWKCTTGRTTLREPMRIFPSLM